MFHLTVNDTYDEPPTTASLPILTPCLTEAPTDIAVLSPMKTF